VNLECESCTFAADINLECESCTFANDRLQAGPPEKQLCQPEAGFHYADKFPPTNGCQIGYKPHEMRISPQTMKITWL